MSGTHPTLPKGGSLECLVGYILLSVIYLFIKRKLTAECYTNTVFSAFFKHLLYKIHTH